MTRAARTIVFGDVHLIRRTPAAVTCDLARLINDHKGARIIVAGDLFDFAAEERRAPLPLERALEEALGAHPALRAALGRHIDNGGELWLTPGNHDAEVGQDGFKAAFLSALNASPEGRGRVRTTPWFFREGGLHVEHGHLYDPDNAPAHPLVIGGTTLGGHFVEQFLAPTGAIRYLNANDSTPLKLFLSSFTWYGPRAPYVIYRYFYAAISAMLKSGPFYDEGIDAASGRARARAFAEETGISFEALDELVALAATPTMKSLSATFSRVYFDRVTATIAMAGGLLAVAGGRTRSGAAALGLGGLLMGASWARGHNRYAGTVAERLAAGAKRVAELTGSKLVIFGHTHREAQDDAYANTASFAFPLDAPGRPFLEIEGPPESPRAVRRHLAPPRS